jgi:glutaminyl-peptide cyclotransferase
MTVMRLLIAVAAAALVSAVAGCPPAQAQPAATAELRPTVIAETPHDTSAFTEGLQFDGPALFESTGLAGHSQLRQLDPATGAVLRAAPLPGGYFGEGIAVVGDHIWQLTYRDGVAIEWDKATLTPVREVPFADEGWGLCRDGDRLIASDGTDTLHFYTTDELREVGSVRITRPDGTAVTGMNELECVDGQVWANIWPTDEIVRIDPASATVTATVDAAALRRGETPRDVLNGIAYAGDGQFLVTGKNWPTTFRVRFDPVA